MCQLCLGKKSMFEAGEVSHMEQTIGYSLPVHSDISHLAVWAYFLLLSKCLLSLRILSKAKKRNELNKTISCTRL